MKPESRRPSVFTEVTTQLVPWCILCVFTVTPEGPGIQVTSGTFTILPNGTCATQTAFLLPSGEAQSREVSATYTRDGSKLTMQWQGAGVTYGTVEGDTFTMENEGQVLLYRKTH